MSNFNIMQYTVGLTCTCPTVKFGKQPTSGSGLKMSLKPAISNQKSEWFEWHRQSMYKQLRIRLWIVPNGDPNILIDLQKQPKATNRQSILINPVFLFSSQQIIIEFFQFSRGTKNKPKPLWHKYGWLLLLTKDISWNQDLLMHQKIPKL